MNFFKRIRINKSYWVISFICISSSVFSQKDSLYDLYIKKADSCYAFPWLSKDRGYDDQMIFAKIYYQKALQIRPQKIYPSDRIKEIERIVFQKEATELSYKYEYLGDSLGNIDDYKRAADAYYKYNELNPSRLDIYNKAVLYSDLANIKNADSLKNFKDYVRNGDKYINTIRNAGKEYGLNLIPESEAEYQKALVILPSSVYISFRLTELKKIKAKASQPKTGNK